MKTVLSFLAALVLSCALIAQTAAQQRSPKDFPSPPRGVEGPEIRKQEPKGAGGAETPTTQKKGVRARGQKPKDFPSPPRGVEGPEIRKQEPKGAGGSDAPKTEKKGAPARSQKPRRTDSTPKAAVEPETKPDAGKKIQ